jgi:hypothetical protein
VIKGTCRHIKMAIFATRMGFVSQQRNRQQAETADSCSHGGHLPYRAQFP